VGAPEGIGGSGETDEGPTWPAPLWRGAAPTWGLGPRAAGEVGDKVGLLEANLAPELHGAGDPEENRLSKAIRNCPLCVMKNCPPGFMISVEGWFRR